MAETNLNKVPRILSAKYLTDYKIQDVFKDKSKREIDLYEFITTSKVIAVRRFLDIALFKQVKVGKDGFDLVWPGNILDLHYEAIFNGRYD